MEKELNIAAILKDKPKGTKLFDTLRGINVCLDSVGIISEHIYCTGDGCLHYYTNTGGFSDECPNGMQILKPSKEMQDWSKFAWKKGDVLVCRSISPHIYTIFDHFTNDDYTKFYGRFHYLYEYCEDRGNTSSKTTIFEKISDKKATRVISSMEKRFGGKLNLSTLEIEKPQFKDGDVVFYEDSEHTEVCSSIFIFQGKQNHTPRFLYHAILDSDGFFNAKEGEFGIYEGKLRLATEEEKQQLFDALAKENKAWDAEKKAIVGLPKKCKFKAFDKVLVRNGSDGTWRADIYSDYKNYVYPHNCIGGMWEQCIPYSDQTAHLLGTTDDWKGGEE